MSHPSLRHWPALVSIGRYCRNGTCGAPRSLRISWLRAVKTDDAPLPLPALLDAVCFHTRAEVERLAITSFAKGCFALAELTGKILLEIEIQQELPLGMEPSVMVMSNFSGGHIATQPPVGTVTLDGAVWIDDAGRHKQLIVDGNKSPHGDEIEMAYALAREANEEPVPERYVTLMEEAIQCR